MLNIYDRVNSQSFPCPACESVDCLWIEENKEGRFFLVGCKVCGNLTDHISQESFVSKCRALFGNCNEINGKKTAWRFAKEQFKMWPDVGKVDWRPDEVIPEDDYAIFPVDENLEETQ